MWDILRKKKVFFTDDDDFENENNNEDKNYYLLALSESDRFNREIESVFEDKPELEIVETLVVDEGKAHEEVELIDMEEQLHEPSENCKGLEKLDDIENNDFFKSLSDGVTYIMEGKEDWFYCVETPADGTICFSSEFIESMLDKYSEHEQDERRDIDPPDNSDNFMSNIAPGSQHEEQEWDMCM